jgi:hypothetical protein
MNISCCAARSASTDRRASELTGLPYSSGALAETSVARYLLAIGLAFVKLWLGFAVYWVVAIM